MAENREGFISEDDELKRIKERKIRELMKEFKEKKGMVGEIIHITDSNFSKVVGENSLVLVDFFADWCMPCRMMAPIVEELAKEYAGKVLVGKINVDENPATAERFQVFSIPTLVILKSGEEVDRIVGFVPKSQIEARLKKYLE
ncbi:MAG: thioredoxin [Candidatus Bathycorpusculaceae bacterium]